MLLSARKLHKLCPAKVIVYIKTSYDLADKKIGSICALYKTSWNIKRNEEAMTALWSPKWSSVNEESDVGSVISDNRKNRHSVYECCLIGNIVNENFSFVILCFPHLNVRCLMCEERLFFVCLFVCVNKCWLFGDLI